MGSNTMRTAEVEKAIEWLEGEQIGKNCYMADDLHRYILQLEQQAGQGGRDVEINTTLGLHSLHEMQQNGVSVHGVDGHRVNIYAASDIADLLLPTAPEPEGV